MEPPSMRGTAVVAWSRKRQRGDKEGDLNPIALQLPAVVGSHNGGGFWSRLLSR